MSRDTFRIYTQAHAWYFLFFHTFLYPDAWNANDTIFNNEFEAKGGTRYNFGSLTPSNVTPVLDGDPV
jgi:hypothetical protein